MGSVAWCIWGFYLMVRAVTGRADFAAAGTDTNALAAWAVITAGFAGAFGVAGQKLRESGSAKAASGAGSPKSGANYGSV